MGTVIKKKNFVKTGKDFKLTPELTPKIKKASQT